VIILLSGEQLSYTGIAVGFLRDLVFVRIDLLTGGNTRDTWNRLPSHAYLFDTGQSVGSTSV
jgi:hypothetical protein